MKRCDTQLARAMLLNLETGRHAAFAVHAALESNRPQIAAKIISPRMINALKILGSIARVVETDQRAAMHATVLERGDRPINITGYHHRHLPENRRTPI